MSSATLDQFSERPGQEPGAVASMEDVPFQLTALTGQPS